MALDTPNKRAAAGGVMPMPDGTIDAADRRQVAGVYPMDGAAPPQIEAVAAAVSVVWEPSAAAAAVLELLARASVRWEPAGLVSAELEI